MKIKSCNAEHGLQIGEKRKRGRTDRSESWIQLLVDK